MPTVRPLAPRLAAVLITCALAASVAYSVYRIPVQVSDSLEVIVASTHLPTVPLLVQSIQWSPTTLRPMRYLQSRWLILLSDRTGASPHLVFRGMHAALAAAIVLLFAWVARPQRWLDVAALAFALTVLIGLHTFASLLQEAFPVNHYAEIAAACLLVTGLAGRPPSRLGQAVMLVVLIGGLLLIESAVLIWIVIAGCAVLRMPGVRRVTAVSATILLVLYLAGRPALGISSPGIGSHGSGFGADVLSADELKARFGANPLPFYAYNIAGGFLSLVAAEPRFGQYQLLASARRDRWSPVVPIHITSSVLLSLLIFGYGWRRLDRRPWHWHHDQQVLALGALVIFVSAGLCITYIKDDIISTAGVFYALLAYLAVRSLLEAARNSPHHSRVVLAALWLLVSAPLWSFRVLGTHYQLSRTAFNTRNDWALDTRALTAASAASPEDASLVNRIRREALRRPLINPAFLPRWGEEYWIE